MERIQSKKHKNGIYKVNKISLSRFDDKRFNLDYDIHTLAYFHKYLKKQIHTNKNNCTKIKIDSDR